MSKAKSTRLSRTARVGIGTTIGLLVLIGGGYLLGHQLAGDKLPARASVGGVSIGGLDRAQAQATLRASFEPKLAAQLVLTSGDTTVSFTPAEAGLGVDYAATVDGLATGDSWNPVQILTVLFGGGPQQPVVTVDQTKLAGQIAALAKQVDVLPVSAGVDYESGKPVNSTSKDGAVVDRDETARTIQAKFLSEKTIPATVAPAQPEVTTEQAEQVARTIAVTAISAPISVQVGSAGTVQVSPKLIEQTLSFQPRDGLLAPVFDADQLVKALDPALNKLGLDQPKDASYTIADGKPKLVPAKDGQGIDPTELASVLAEAAIKTDGRSGTVSVAARPAGFTTEQAKALGVKEIVGKFTTYFPGTAYRYNNIGKAAKLINGTFLKPGETFSMNKTLGKRTKEAGWMAGGAIDGGKIVERLGGGISQATTTTFNAIFFAGLEDVYHKPHSLYFNRYPVGREATLDWDSVDMKFKNDSPYGVVLRAWITGHTGSQGSVIVQVWSTKRYTIKTTTPVRSNYRAPGPTIYDESDGCKPQNAMSGFDVKFDRLFYQGKKLVKREPFAWRYNSLTPVVCGAKPKK